MDFEAILHVAKKNQMKRPEPVKCLQTKFKPPTKEQKDKEKTLSDGVMRFLAKKEEEERKKKEEAARQREQLSALRAKDPKANKRIQHMLKRTKSANKSVMNDVDQSNTADTISGPIQPDDDDYGFVSAETSALYNKVMQKMYNAPSEDIKFAPSKKPTSTNIISTKERVKMALLRQEEEEKLPHRRKRRRKSGEAEDDSDILCGAPERNVDKQPTNDNVKGTSEKPKPRRQAAPPIDFMELLKLAEKKQHEPIVIEPKVRKDVEPEQLMTKKQKEEQRRNDELRRQKEARARGEVAPSPTVMKRIPKIGENKSNMEQKRSEKSEKGRVTFEINVSSSSKPKSLPPIPRKSESETEKLRRECEQARKELKEKQEAIRLLEEKEKLMREMNEARAKLKAIEDKETKIKDCDIRSKSTSSSSKDIRRSDLPKSAKDYPSKDVTRPGSHKPSNTSKESSSKTASGHSSSVNSKDIKKSDAKPPTANSKLTPQKDVRPHNGSRDFPPKDVRPANGSRPFPPKDIRPPNGIREFPPKDVRPANGSRTFPPKDIRPPNGIREFPPKDVRPSNGSRPAKRPMSKEEYIRKKLNALKKRRIDDSEEEYDSEMDDFIDDGPDATLDGTEDVSAVIQQIFKYDKNKYSRYDDDNDECMESNWGQVEREEKHSARIGYLEDVADMLEEKKALARKKQKR